MADATPSPRVGARPPTRAARRPGNGSGSAPELTWLAALAVFAVVLILLAWRMLAGNDPALGAAQPEQAAAAPAERVIVRRIIRRKIVVTTKAPTVGRPLPVADAPATDAANPVRVGAAPGPASTAPAPAPAPAPVTRSS